MSSPETPPQPDESLELKADGPERPSRWSGVDWAWLIAVTLVALVIRLIYNHQLQSSPFFDHPSIDAKLHVDWATAIAEGRNLFEGVYPRAPLYPWLLGILYSIVGVDFVIPRVLAAIMGAGSCGLLYAIAHRYFGRCVAVLAGLVAATYWVSVFFDGELLVEPLTVFLNLLGLWLLVRIERPGLASWTLAGVCFGLSALNRPNVLLVVPVLACWPIVTYGLKQWREWWLRVLAFGAACVIVILPVTVRNYVKGGEAVLIASNGGFNFYIGNNPQSDGMMAVLPGVRPDWWGGMQDAASIAQANMGRKLSAGEVSSFYYRAALRFMRDQPRQAFRLMMHKLRYFWNDVEVPNPHNLYFFADKYTPIVRFLPVSFGLLVPFAFVGVLLSGRRRLVGQFPLWGYGLAYMVGIVAFFVTSRFRLPIVPIVILYASFGLVELLRSIANRKWILSAACVLAVVLLWPFLHTEDIAGLKDHAVSYCKVARALGEQKRFEEAEAACRSAIEKEPENPLAYEVEGELKLAQNDLRGGIQSLKRAIELDADRPVYGMLTDALIATNRLSEARRVLEQGVKALPGQVELKFRLAWLLSTCSNVRVRDGEAALKIANDALESQQLLVPLLDAKAAALAELGRYQEASVVAKSALDSVGMSREEIAIRRAISERIKLYDSGRPFRDR
ncbi:MAG: glycosyltransferase family 39 protein [Phycisphaerales bacterium]|nr:glycosyltransferase family 39 protein [Phycisphaerales bacterium]